MTNEIILIIVGSIATTASGIASWAIKESRTANKRSREMNDATHEGLVALLRDRLQTNYDEISQREGVTHAEARNFSALFKAYEKLGGNGHITRLAAAIRDMPTRK